MQNKDDGLLASLWLQPGTWGELLTEMPWQRGQPTASPQLPAALPTTAVKAQLGGMDWSCA